MKKWLCFEYKDKESFYDVQRALLKYYKWERSDWVEYYNYRCYRYIMVCVQNDLVSGDLSDLINHIYIGNGPNDNEDDTEYIIYPMLDDFSIESIESILVSYTMGLI